MQELLVLVFGFVLFVLFSAVVLSKVFWRQYPV